MTDSILNPMFNNAFNEAINTAVPTLLKILEGINEEKLAITYEYKQTHAVLHISRKLTQIQVLILTTYH